MTRLNAQLAHEKQAREQSVNERDELLSVQQQDAERTENFEQQLEQLSSRLQESEQLQSQQKQAEQQQSQILAEKKAEITELQMALKDKTELFEKLQTEQESSQFADELNIVKQQLQQMEVELNVKNEQIEQFERASQSVANDKDRITELEAQIEKLNSSREPEAMQDQVAKLESQLMQLEQEKQVAESNTEHSAELENTVQEHNQQLLQLNGKLESFLTQTQSVTQDDKLQAEEV